jgi:chemotaxis protein CheZ
MPTSAVQQSATDFGQNLSRRIQELKAERGDTVAITDIAAVVESLMTSLEGDISAVDLKMQRELRALVQYIAQAKADISAIQPSDIPRQYIPEATDELDAVVKATEHATQAILDAAEKLGEVAGALGGPVGDRILAITTTIFEASNFQDITGQRISKVVRALRHIEEKIIALARAFGQEIESSLPPIDERSGDAKLLNGPQLPANANSQDSIDAMFD